MRTFADIPIFEYGIIDSTQVKARKWLEKSNSQGSAPKFGILSAHRADSQTNGRGRKDRQWLDLEGYSLLVTFVVSPQSQNYWIEVAKVMLSFQEVLLKIGICSSIKWPNDIVVETNENYKKLAGCLTEIENGQLLVGVGLNLGYEFLHDELKEISTSIERFNVFITPNELLDMVLAQYREINLQRDDVQILSLINDNCSTLGNNVKVDQAGGEIVGTANRIESNGNLVLQVDDSEIFIAEGDVIKLRAI